VEPAVLRLSRRHLLTAAAALPATRLLGATPPVSPSTAAEKLYIVQDGIAATTVVVAADAGELELVAAEDLLKYVALMSGATLAQIRIAASAPLPTGPVIVLGKAALRADRSLDAALDNAAKKRPFLSADSIVLRRTGNRLYVAGNSDRAHYFAVSRLLQEWGCRWYMPTEFGEVVPEQATLTIGTLDYAYGSPFEIRNYWLSWLGDSSGQLDFQRRNFSSTAGLPIAGHALGQYTKSLIPAGKTAFNIPLSEDATAIEVAAQIEAQYAKGVPSISLAIEDGIYTSDSKSDRELQAFIYDKYMIAPSNTDAVLTLYNKVAAILRGKYPESPTKLGGLAYANVTLPPQRVLKMEPNIVMWLAPIDIDPNHGMDDANSPPRQEYKAMMYRWAQILEGRLAIYDYDQGQLVWRDLPNPSHHVFAADVQQYRKAGVLGIATESRGATATTFLNLFFRLQLMWNPDLDVDTELAEFFPKFYGPAAVPMASYWTAIFAAWKGTLVTEHEYMIAPAIYTPALIDRLRVELAAARSAIGPLRRKADPSRNEKLYLQRMRFTELSFDVIDNYMAMVQAAATDADYPKAVLTGERALATRELLTGMNPTFTTYKKIGEEGPSWLPGEVAQMRELGALTKGVKGTLVARLPLEWAFRRDPHDTGLPRGWAYTPADLSTWNTIGRTLSPGARKDYPDAWEMLRTDLYMQAQGIRHPDRQSFTGYYWYQTEVELTPKQVTGPLHLMFPGLFNECWLYVNGELIADRAVPLAWWRNDYRFEWDVDVERKLKAGTNLISLRGRNPHHFGGIFRRPFGYRAKSS
jgi:hypothetical protein